MKGLIRRSETTNFGKSSTMKVYRKRYVEEAR
jgi:hypothetical protein